ncbi:MAG: hypothetical protein ACHQ2Y_01845 [Candidatus Lutacidiplasmatales archaeon]
MFRRISRRTAIALSLTGVALLLAGAVYASATPAFYFGSTHAGTYAGNLTSLYKVEKPTLGGAGAYVGYPITFNTTTYWVNFSVSGSQFGWSLYWMNASEFALLTSPTSPSISALGSFSASPITVPPLSAPGYFFGLSPLNSGSYGSSQLTVHSLSSWYGPGAFYLVFVSTAVHSLSLTVDLEVSV